MSAPAIRLQQLAARFQVERALGRVLCGGGFGLLLAGVTFRAGVARSDALGLVFAGLVAGAVVAWIERRRRPVGATLMARHLDRVLPELEESTGLLLIPPDELGALARRQRLRVERHWDTARASQALPHGALRRSLLLSLPGLALGLPLLLLPQPVRGLRTVAADDGSGATLTLRRIVVDVAPPAYTAAPSRRLDGGDLEAEEGATLTWRLETAGAVERVWLLPTAGDSAEFTGDEPGRWRLTSRAERSQLVRVRLTGAAGLVLTSDDYRLAVRPDKPPVLTIVRPEERTELEPGGVAPVGVEVLAADDYGVDSVTMAVTIASGRGEAVRFRRLRLPFTGRERTPDRAVRLRATLDLEALGLAAGDELYFHVEARDRRTPVPNHSRSATVFITVQDTGSALTADLARLALGAQPEYFRSQRQIVIDTEKLLKQQRRMPVATFRNRSNELGIDQGLLRLRYGQFLGEEFEEDAREMSGREHAAETEAEPPKLEDQLAGAEAEGAEDKAAAELSHQHDDPENATLLGASIKDKLRAAVAAMWQAELHLRTGEPRLALPFELRALGFIKAVQQDARVYVQKVGFEPPPLEEAKLRLTGKLTGVRDQDRSSDPVGQRSYPCVRAALAAVRELGIPGPDPTRSAELAGLLELAGQELAGPAVDDPRLLPTLRDLRQLADTLRRGAGCSACTGRVERGLWQALPSPEPRAGPGNALGGSPVAERLARLLAGRRR